MITEDYQENYLSGYIKLYRSTMLKSWFQKSEYVHMWVHILMKANHKKAEGWFKGEPLKLNPGQFITGTHLLSSETGINREKVRRILKCFENDQQITIKSSSKGSLISINNWKTYQMEKASDHHFDQQVTNKRPTSDQQVTTNNNERNKEDIYRGKSTTFQPPTLDAVKQYFSQKNQGSDMAEAFYHFYNSKGWMVGKNKMKKWKSAAAGWLSRNQQENGTQKFNW